MDERKHLRTSSKTFLEERHHNKEELLVTCTQRKTTQSQSRSVQHNETWLVKQQESLHGKNETLQNYINTLFRDLQKLMHYKNSISTE